MNFEFASANRIIFGAGSIKEAGALAFSLGRRAFVVSGKSAGRVAPLLETLAKHQVAAVLFPVSQEPTIELVEEGVQLAKNEGCDLVIGIGGGSSLDAGKAIAAMLTNPGKLLDYVEIIGKGQLLLEAPAPFIAIPTTAGTGSEATRNAVLSSPVHKRKVSLRSPLMLPRLVIIDPELTYSMPQSVTAATGLDALTQVIEPFVANAATPITDAFCREGLRRAARSLQRAYEHGEDRAAREDMAIVSLLGGLALANAKLGAVHGFAGVIGGMFDAPHGAVCAALLPHVMSANIRSLQIRQPDNTALKRYDEIAQLLTDHFAATAPDGILWVRNLCQNLKLPGLHTFGVTMEAFPAIVENSASSSSMKGNPIKLTPDEMREILSQAL
jgi:alcohol dehydrogenase class IV